MELGSDSKTVRGPPPKLSYTKVLKDHKAKVALKHAAPVRPPMPTRQPTIVRQPDAPPVMEPNVELEKISLPTHNAVPEAYHGNLAGQSTLPHSQQQKQSPQTASHLSGGEHRYGMETPIQRSLSQLTFNDSLYPPEAANPKTHVEQGQLLASILNVNLYNGVHVKFFSTNVINVTLPGNRIIQWSRLEDGPPFQSKLKPGEFEVLKNVHHALNELFKPLHVAQIPCVKPIERQNPASLNRVPSYYGGSNEPSRPHLAAEKTYYSPSQQQQSVGGIFEQIPRQQTSYQPAQGMQYLSNYSSGYTPSMPSDLSGMHFYNSSFASQAQPEIGRQHLPPQPEIGRQHLLQQSEIGRQHLIRQPGHQYGNGYSMNGGENFQK